MIAVACRDGTVVLWDRAHKINVKLQHHPVGDQDQAQVFALAFTSDGKLLVSGGQDGRIVIWDVQRRAQKGAAVDSHRPVFALAIGKGDKTIASGHNQRPSLSLEHQL